MWIPCMFERRDLRQQNRTMEVASSFTSSATRSSHAYIYELIVTERLLPEKDLTSVHSHLNSQIEIVTSDCECYQTLSNGFYCESLCAEISEMIKHGHCPCTHDDAGMDKHTVKFNFTHVAAALGRCLVLKQLLDHGCVLGTRTLPSNWTALIYAVRLKHTDCVNLILNYSENTLSIPTGTARSMVTMPALCKGEDHEKEQPAGFCQDERRSLNAEQNLQMQNDIDSQDYVEHDCLDMIFFAVSLNSDTLERLFNCGKCFIPRNIQKLFQLLVQAIHQGLLNLSILLEAGADPNAQSLTGMTPLFYVVRNYYNIMNYTDKIAVLVGAGAALNIHDDRDDTPLLTAIAQGNKDIVETLLELGADPNYYTVGGHPALTLASLQSTDMLKSLINHGAYINATNTEFCYSALHMAAWEGQLEAVDILLEANALVDEQTKDRNTPLSLAAHGNYEQTVKRLLELGCCDVNNADKDLDTPLIYATFNDNTELVDMLLTHGADPHMANSLMCTPLWNAVYTGNLQNVRRLLLCNVEMEVCSVGIDQHANGDTITHIYQQSRSPLWIAVTHGSQKIVQLLLQSAYNLQKETWIRRDGDLDTTEEFDMYFEDPDVITEHLLPVVRYHGSKPLSLLGICSRFFRSTFRKNLKYITEQLPIPATLKAHLNLEFM